MDKQKFYKVADICEIYGISRNSIPAMIEAGTIPEPLPRKGKGQRFWRKQDVDEHSLKKEMNKRRTYSGETVNYLSKKDIKEHLLNTIREKQCIEYRYRLLSAIDELLNELKNMEEHKENETNKEIIEQSQIIFTALGKIVLKL